MTVVWSPLYLPLLLFLALGLIQFSANLTLDPVAAREAVIKLVTDLLLFFLTMQLLASAPLTAWRLLATIVTVFAFALALLAILQYFSSGGLILWIIETSTGSSFGTYVNRNHFAGLMEMLIPIAVARTLGREDETPLRGFSAFAIGVPLSSAPLSGSRGGLIALTAEVALLSVILGAFSPKRRNRSRWAHWQSPQPPRSSS